MMTVKATPKTETVRELLQNQLDAYNKKLGEAKSELEKLNTAHILTPSDSAAHALKAQIEYINDDIEAVGTKLAILDSHTGPRVLTEIQI